MIEIDEGEVIKVWYLRPRKEPFFYQGKFVTQDAQFLTMDDRYQGIIVLNKKRIDKILKNGGKSAN